MSNKQIDGKYVNRVTIGSEDYVNLTDASTSLDGKYVASGKTVYDGDGTKVSGSSEVHNARSGPSATATVYSSGEVLLMKNNSSSQIWPDGYVVLSAENTIPDYKVVKDDTIGLLTGRGVKRLEPWTGGLTYYAARIPFVLDSDGVVSFPTELEENGSYASGQMSYMCLGCSGVNYRHPSNISDIASAKGSSFFSQTSGIIWTPNNSHYGGYQMGRTSTNTVKCLGIWRFCKDWSHTCYVENFFIATTGASTTAAQRYGPTGSTRTTVLKNIYCWADQKEGLLQGGWSGLDSYFRNIEDIPLWTSGGTYAQGSLVKINGTYTLDLDSSTTGVSCYHYFYVEDSTLASTTAPTVDMMDDCKNDHTVYTFCGSWKQTE